MGAMDTREAAQRIEEMMGAAEATPEAPQDPPEQLAQEQAETPEPEQESIDAKAGETEEVESEEESEDSPEEAWTPTTLDDLAEGLAIDTDALKAIRVKTKVDGIEGEATLADLVKSYQIDKSLTNKSESLANQRKEFEAASQAHLQTLQSRLQEIDALAQTLEGQIEEQVGRIDWQQLRIDDPAEYAAKRQEFVEQIGAVQAQKQKAIEVQQRQAQELQQQMNKQQQERLVAEHNALVEAVPEWRDEATRTKEMGEVVAFLRNRGISDQEISGIWDHRMVLFARDAMRYQRMQEKAEPVKKQAKSKPKFVKPGARQGENAAAVTRKNQLRQTLKKTGNVKDAAALLLDRI